MNIRGTKISYASHRAKVNKENDKYLMQEIERVDNLVSETQLMKTYFCITVSKKKSNS
jgi:hypothetical protein